MSGLRLQEDTCPIRIENSIAFGNATISGSNVEVFVGAPISAALGDVARAWG